MSAGNDFWATRAGIEFLSSAKNIARALNEKNDILKEQNEILETKNELLKQQIDLMSDIKEALRYLR